MEPQLSCEYKKNNDKYLKSNFYECVKRLFDVIVSIMGLIILSPILFITAIAVRIDTKGPVVFSQMRCGKDGKVFKMYKFRSMDIGAEKKNEDLLGKNEMLGPVFKIKDDPRVTRVGRFIRRKSIDELPQLVNVIKGEMSIVGPRPPIDKEVLSYSSYHMQRLLIKPGLTCYWQTMGRNKIGFEQWVELDIKYISERNAWIDLKLIFKTIIVLFRDDNGW